LANEWANGSTGRSPASPGDNPVIL